MFAAIAVGSACTSGHDTADPTPPATSSAVETGSGVAQKSTTPRPLAGPGPERDCEESVSGDLGRDWRSHTILVGPVGFVARFYRDAPRADFAPVRPGRYRGQKVLLLVRRGTIVDTPRASLMYDPSKWPDRNAYRVAGATDP